MHSSFSIRLAIAAVILLVVNIANGQAPAVPKEVAQAMQDRDYDLAIKELAAALESLSAM